MSSVIDVISIASGSASSDHFTLDHSRITSSVLDCLTCLPSQHCIFLSFRAFGLPLEYHHPPISRKIIHVCLVHRLSFQLQGSTQRIQDFSSQLLPLVVCVHPHFLHEGAPAVHVVLKAAQGCTDDPYDYIDKRSAQYFCHSWSRGLGLHPLAPRAKLHLRLVRILLPTAKA